jgi:hypothetical protein
MPVQLNCLFGRAGTEAPPVPLQYATKAIETFFDAASNGEIALNIDDSKLNPTLLSNGVLSTAQLHSALMLLVSNSARPISNIGVVFANRFDGDDSLLGLMYDVDFDPGGDPFTQIPREGCAVFAGTIKSRTGGDEAAYRTQLAYAAIHELGHVFNLGHLDTTANFMRSKPPSTFPNDLDFVVEQKALLSQCAIEYVMPGGSAYGVLGSLTPSGTYEVSRLGSVDAFALRLEIDMTQREFWYFEPVELDITLSVAPGILRPVTIPRSVDPAYESFEIWIDEPDGSRRRYRPTKHFCAPGNDLTIHPGKSFRRDVSIFGGSGLYTFRTAGVHRLRARMRLPDGGVLESNAVEVNLLPLLAGKGARFDGFSRTLSDASHARFLFYREAMDDLENLDPLRDFAGDYSDTPAGAGVDYALGRWLHRVARLKRKSLRRSELMGKAMKHLSRAISSTRLSTHREEKAIEIVDDETSS